MTCQPHTHSPRPPRSQLDLPTPMTVPPTMACTEAITIMEKHGFDQLPVVDDAPGGSGVAGVVALGDVLAKILAGRVQPSAPVEAVMFTQFKQVPLNTPLSVLSHIFRRDSFCLVVASQVRRPVTRPQRSRPPTPPPFCPTQPLCVHQHHPWGGSDRAQAARTASCSCTRRQW